MSVSAGSPECALAFHKVATRCALSCMGVTEAATFTTNALSLLEKDTKLGSTTTRTVVCHGDILRRVWSSNNTPGV